MVDPDDPQPDRAPPRGAILCVVDGGGTGTRLRLHRPDGAVLGEGRSGPSSLTLGVERAWRHVCEALDRAAGAAGIEPPSGPGLRLAAALAGSRSPERRAAFLAANPRRASLTLISDGHAALLGALDGAPGSVVAVGTGIAARRLHRDGRVTVVSGWGFPVADEGSGAWIGCRAVRAHLRRRDGRSEGGPEGGSILFAGLERRLGRTREAALSWLLEADATRYAALAPEVAAAAEAGDALAAAIMDEAAAEVAAALGALERGDEADPAAITGGLADALRGRLPGDVRARLVTPRGTALDGALRVLTGRSPAEPPPAADRAGA